MLTSEQGLQIKQTAQWDMKYFIQTKESTFGKAAAKAARNSDKTAVNLYYVQHTSFEKYNCLEFATLIYFDKNK